MKRNSFIFYSSYKEALDNLPDDQKLNLYNAICEYALNNKVVKLKTKTEKSLFNLIVPTLDSSIKRYEANVKNGKKGGAPKGNQNATKSKGNIPEKTTEIQPKNNPNSTQQTSENQANKQPKNNLNYNYNYNYNENYNNNSIQNKTNKIKVDKEKTTENELNCVGKKKYYFELLKEKLNKVLNHSNLEFKNFGRVNSILDNINKQDKFIIQGKEILSCDVLQSLVNLFACDYNDVILNFDNIFETIDSAEKINDKLKYSVAVMYKASKNLSV